MGGGGAGGMVSLTGQNYDPGSYPVTIGLGGQPKQVMVMHDLVIPVVHPPH